MLELTNSKSTWTPPGIGDELTDEAVEAASDRSYGACYLHIFITEPYIDSLFIRFQESEEPETIKRFTVCAGYSWDTESEEFFHENCVKVQGCGYSGAIIEEIYRSYSTSHPEWHLKRYYTNGLRLIDHIYNCVKENTVKEMLYKSGLDELAANIDELDEIDLLAGKPSDIYDGLSMKVLRSVNCPDGARLIGEKSVRAFIKELNKSFPDIFKDRLNDAQCRYMLMLIKGDLVVGEAGRLFRSRKEDLSHMWSKSLFETFMESEKHEREESELLKTFGCLDPIYADYIKNTPNPGSNPNIKQLEFFLLHNREEYDNAIRRSNRRRDPDWQERDDRYLVRFPQTINDFCREALYMRNCLMTYVDAMINNDTTILFMRRVDDPNTPFITIEIYGKELKQAYHRFNTDCTEDEAGWIKEYCERHDIGRTGFSFDARRDLLF